MEYTELFADDEVKIGEMSEMATEIVREHFDPIIGKAQNDYMLKLFQTKEAIKKQLEDGYRYFFVRNDGRKYRLSCILSEKRCYVSEQVLSV